MNTELQQKLSSSYRKVYAVWFGSVTMYSSRCLRVVLSIMVIAKKLITNILLKKHTTRMCDRQKDFAIQKWWLSSESYRDLLRVVSNFFSFFFPIFVWSYWSKWWGAFWSLKSVNPTFWSDHPHLRLSLTQGSFKKPQF